MNFNISLNDRFDLTKEFVLLNGSQALVRLCLIQAERDKVKGLNTSGYITGYRGSPLGAVDQQFNKAKDDLIARDITFREALNEDLAATSIWGAQQANIRGDGKTDGVYALWYGKGPGVDRSGDVFRHANLAGTDPNGGVLVAMGDDHTGESSTALHQSEYALIDAMMPILSPSGVQEIIDFGILGWELSRYAGVWVGLKCMKDTIEVTEVVDGSAQRIKVNKPDFSIPDEGVQIRTNDLAATQEERLHKIKIPAVKAFARKNKLNKEIFERKGARIGLLSAGKSWLDTIHALSLLGIDEKKAKKIGITTFKVGMVWPLEEETLVEWASGLDLVIVVEEKRKLLEDQVKAILYNKDRAPKVIGGQDEFGNEYLKSTYALDPTTIGDLIGQRLISETDDKGIRDSLADLRKAIAPVSNIAAKPKVPYFCAGCPHNSSTKVPSGSRAYAGIGCHYMAQWMERETEGYTQMGGEGANWIGESLFSNRKHVFQNLGDGTYNHSGILAVRAAVASGANITYKILFNDAVAMTGGQSHEGDISAFDIIRELKAIGLKKVVGVYDKKEQLDLGKYRNECEMFEREYLDEVQTDLSKIHGVTAIVFIQTCAAEKRRRRKKGLFPNPKERVFINPDVCEGCGDCGVESNCVAILPLETALGRKRQIDQSACNKDFSCLQGFCPSFVTIDNAVPKKLKSTEIEIPELQEVQVPQIDGTFNVVITGVGGTGVVTVGALLAMASHLESKGVGVMEMAGLAQKGGAVHIHCRIANKPESISAIRVSLGEVNSLIGCELSVSAGEKTLSLLRRGFSKGIISNQEANSGEFTRDPNFKIPTDGLKLAINARIGPDSVQYIDSQLIAERLMGDTIYANIVMLGASYQAGLLPLSAKALKQAIVLNGANVDQNLKAFDIGRLWISDQGKILQKISSFKGEDVEQTEKFDDILSDRYNRLLEYQNKSLADKYKKKCLEIKELSEDIALSVAKSYFKLLAYKDEYEVARLHQSTLLKNISENFDKASNITFYLSPPIISQKGKDGKMKKKAFGSWMLTAFAILSWLKFLRGTVFDIFGYSAERVAERELIQKYESDLERIKYELKIENFDLLMGLSLWPMDVKGFGHVKARNMDLALLRRDDVIQRLSNKTFVIKAAE